MKRILKYEIPIADEFEISIPNNSMFLSIQVQNNKPVIWFRVDDEFPEQNVKFNLLTTGQDISIDTCGYLGTFLIEGFVGHLFLWIKN